MSEEIIKRLEKCKKILFGPFVGEYGWEIIRWSGFVNWYKINNPDKKIFASTRESSADLYFSKVDGINLFELNGDNLSLVPECYLCVGLKPDDRMKIIQDAARQFGAFDYIVDPTNLGHEKKIFDFKNMIFNYSPRKENKLIIKSILDKKNKDNKKVITLCPRYRTDFLGESNKRNWGEENWESLFNKLEKSGKYFSLIIGKKDTICIPNREYKNFSVVSEYIDNNIKFVSDVGVAIEAIKASGLTVGSQTGNIVISNLLRVPTLFWGNEIQRHAVDENLFKTISIGIEDNTFSINPKKIFDEIEKFHGFTNIIVKAPTRILEKKKRSFKFNSNDGYI